MTVVNGAILRGRLFMIAKLIIASLLVGASAASVGQDAPRTADG